jgi:hypothetical protein
MTFRRQRGLAVLLTGSLPKAVPFDDRRRRGLRGGTMGSPTIIRVGAVLYGQ